MTDRSRPGGVVIDRQGDDLTAAGALGMAFRPPPDDRRYAGDAPHVIERDSRANLDFETDGEAAKAARLAASARVKNRIDMETPTGRRFRLDAAEPALPADAKEFG